MSITRTHEDQYLDPARRVIDERLAALPAIDTDKATLDVLEAAASILGGFRLGAYWRRSENDSALAEKQALDIGGQLVLHLKKTPLNCALALSALARPNLEQNEQRSSGVYHTDFRLAMHMAVALGQLRPNMRIIDPACGSGILLVAATLRAIKQGKININKWLASSVFAADLSCYSLRGAKLALASLTNDVDAIAKMSSHWYLGDSLLSDGKTINWKNKLFDLVIGNPPWEKMKATRHEFLRANGSERHYGANYDTLDDIRYSGHRSERSEYAQEVVNRYPMMQGGEPDLYKPFLELSTRLLQENGRLSILVPAGLIRSQGTECLRRYLMETSSDVELTVFENRARFFAIDTRFKFLLVSATRKASSKIKRATVLLSHGTGAGNEIEVTKPVRIGVKDLIAARPDLTVPEVRSDKEWRLFQSFTRRGVKWDQPESEWYPKIVREVDMTRDRQYFMNTRASDSLPLIEGRMIHHHRFGCKGYQSGSGRRASWRVLEMGNSAVVPQFWFPVSKMSRAVIERSSQLRAGFCDITGQTNERSLLAALIPPGVVCGNKVPTVTFVNDQSVDRLDLWIGIVNSLPFDWLLRRVITTTVNYFLLLSIPLPNISPKSTIGKRIIKNTRELRTLDTLPAAVHKWRAAELRAEIDVAILEAYGGTADDLVVILNDFPLIDRGQPPILGENKSTITRDLVLSKVHSNLKRSTSQLHARIEMAKRIGACAYIPAEFLATINYPEERVCYA